MTETLIGLVAQYSPSGQERGAVEWLVTRMQALGYTDVFIDGAGNAIGMMGTGPRQVLLLGHIDTVPGEIEVTLSPNPAVSDSGAALLHGRGAVDAKGPLASFVDAVAQVGPMPGWQFVVIGAVEEERNSDGARFIVDKYRPDFLIVGEPNRWDRIALGYKGSAWAQVTVRRGQMHTASGEETAAEAAVAAWLKIKAWVDAYNADKTKAFDQLLLTLRGMESDSGAFEQWARLRVGVRLPVEMPPEQWYAHLRTMLGDAADVQALGFAVPAWKCEKNTPLVRAFLGAIRAQGGTPSFVYKTGTADLNVVAPVWQCPAVVYGPGDSALDHTPHEHIALQEYEQSVAVLSAALKQLINNR